MVLPFEWEATMERRNLLLRNAGAVSVLLALALTPSSDGRDAAHSLRNLPSATSGATPVAQVRNRPSHDLRSHFGELPILFEPNVGQAD
jgi:hypothetical protein